MLPEDKPSGAAWIIKTAIGTIAAAAIAVTPFTMEKEGTVYRAYRDPTGKPTICNGHTKGVKLGDVASEEECRTYLKEDLTEAMIYVVRYSPAIVENPNALMAAGDFTLNTGHIPYRNSPMITHFNNREWESGCRAFTGYYTGATFSKKQSKYSCKQKPNGKWLCALPGLIERRKEETLICLGQK